MKKAGLIFVATCLCSTVVYAGPEPLYGKDKEVRQAPPPVCDWFRAHEWNVDLWGTYAFSANPGTFHVITDDDFFDSPDEVSDPSADPTTDEHLDVGPRGKDGFLGKDDAFGGGVDVKYFWNKYFAVGVEGFVVAAHDTGGAGLGTLTVRYPIGCSRFAPYGFAGVGALFGGSQLHHFLDETHTTDTTGAEVEIDGFHDRYVRNNDVRVIGQFGGGLEVRICHHFGVMSDFAWNVIDGENSDHQDFGMVRFGATLSY